MNERIQKIIAARGLCSRRSAEQLLLDGRVTINGRTAMLGESAGDTAQICVDGVPLPPAPERIWIMLNKPRGYVTTLSDERGRKTAASLVSCGKRVFPVGRLDMDSEGLLLFTNDGALANRLSHPRTEQVKYYEVTVRGADAQSVHCLRRPIELDGRPIAPPEVTLLRESGDKTCYRIGIHEGRNRQIRRMCEAAGLHVARLCRVQEGPLTLGTLRVGQWRYLTAEEFRQLEHACGGAL